MRTWRVFAELVTKVFLSAVRQDVAIDTISNPQVIRVTLKTSKTNPFREGADTHIQRTNNNLCPVAALLAWLVKRSNTPGPLFLFASGAPFTRAKFVVELKKAICTMGKSIQGFSGHSFRSRAATTAVNQMRTSSY